MVNILAQSDVFINFKGTVENLKAAAGMAAKYTGNVTKQFQQNTQESRKNVSAVHRQGREFRMFRMELLSTMFVGQMLSKTMQGLMQPAMQTAGIFELFGAILELLFLPIALALIDPLVAILDWVGSMPEELKLVIGAIALFLMILGSIVAFVSQVGLLLGGFGMTFTSLGGIIAGAFGVISATITSALAAIFAVFGWWIIVIVAIILVLIGAIIMNIDGFVNTFINLFTNLTTSLVNMWQGFADSVIGIILIFVGIFQGLFTGNWDMLNLGIQTFLSGIKQLFIDGFGGLVGTALQFGYELIEAFAVGIGNAYSLITDVIRGIPFIGPLIAGGMDAIGGFAGSITGAIGRGIQGIGDFVGGLIPKFGSGGIVTSPTLAMVGEAGPEAIVPLNGSMSGGQGQVINFSPTYNINNELSNSADIDYMLNEIERRQANDYERLRKA